MKDKKIKSLISAEEKRQKKTINLIASENYPSKDSSYALDTIFSSKYAEGYPDRRYYGGNKIVDQVESLAQKRAMEVFGLSEKKWSVNVQPLSGTPANLAIYFALIPTGSKMLAMSLDHGGHLSHGFSVTVSGKVWKQIAYGVDKKTERIDYDQVEKLAKKHKPKIIIAGFSAYPREIKWKRFKDIADSVGAILLADISHIAGLIAGGVHSSPFRYADVVMTTTHKTLRGPRGAVIFSRKDKREFDKKIDKTVFPGMQGGPHINSILAKAVAFKEAQSADFKKYTKQVIKNAKALCSELKSLGWPIVSGGTDNHIVLVDTWKNGDGVSGKKAALALEKEGIVVNKNVLPFDQRKPFDPSGVRLGTAAETTRGLKELDFIKIAHQIDKILKKAIK